MKGGWVEIEKDERWMEQISCWGSEKENIAVGGGKHKYLHLTRWKKNDKTACEIDVLYIRDVAWPVLKWHKDIDDQFTLTL